MIQYLAAELGLIERGYNGMPKESQAVSLISGFLDIWYSRVIEIYLLYRLGKPLTDKEDKKAS